MNKCPSVIYDDWNAVYIRYDAYEILHFLIFLLCLKNLWRFFVQCRTQNKYLPIQMLAISSRSACWVVQWSNKDTPQRFCAATRFRMICIVLFVYFISCFFVVVTKIAFFFVACFPNCIACSSGLLSRFPLSLFHLRRPQIRWPCVSILQWP